MLIIFCETRKLKFSAQDHIGSVAPFHLFSVKGPFKVHPIGGGELEVA